MTTNMAKKIAQMQTKRQPQEGVIERNGRWYHPLDFHGFETRKCAEADYALAKGWAQ